MTHIRLAIDRGLASLVLAHPPQNRIDTAMVAELAAALDTVERGAARALLVRAEGADFSFGGDIAPWPTMTVRELRAAFEVYMATFNRFERLAIPTVAAVQGLCFGGGLELAVRADVIIAAETARFGHPEQSIGIVTLLGGVHRIAERAGRARAIEWALTSEQVPAAVMRDHGVVNRVVDEADLLAAATAFARTLAAGPHARPRRAQGAAAGVGRRRNGGRRRGAARYRHAAVREPGREAGAGAIRRSAPGERTSPPLRLRGPMMTDHVGMAGQGFEALALRRPGIETGIATAVQETPQ